MKINNKQIKEIFLHSKIFNTEYSAGASFDNGTEIIDIHFEDKRELEWILKTINHFLKFYEEE